MTYPLHSVLGIELEYAIVDRHTGDVRPIAEEVLRDATGTPVSELRRGVLMRNNELVRHVLEINLAEPLAEIAGLERIFHEEVCAVNAALAEFDACLMPGPVHPWMDPAVETELWPFENGEWYQTFDRIFNCRRHGWANLQSMHLNFPFSSEAEFGRLHAAIRLLLPIIPALSAASPYADGRCLPYRDGRLHTYRTNAVLVPAITGDVIPEAAFTRGDYEAEILQPLYAAIAPHDPEGILQQPWINARGAITRFDRGSIEIRIIDSQECPAADLAIAWAIRHVVRALCDERWTDSRAQMRLPQKVLCELFSDCVKAGEDVVVEAPEYVAAFGLSAPVATKALWEQLLREVVPRNPTYDVWYELYRKHGTLASRMLRAAGDEPSRDELRSLVRQLCSCLADNSFFESAVCD